MINRISLLLIVSGIIGSLSSCGMFSKDKDDELKHRGEDYLRAEPIRKIDIPEGMSATTLEPLYPVPDVQAVDDFGDKYNLVEYDIPRPDPINSDEQALGVKIQKLGREKWISLSASTSQVWPRTQSFLTSADVDVANSNATSGVIETDWVQFKDDESVMARFRIRLEKGIHPDTTEVHVRQVQVPMGQDVSLFTEWPEVSTDPSREEWLMRELANHLAETIDNASASLLGQNVGGEVKASYDRGASEPTLLLNLSSERAWATVSRSAKEEGYVTWEANKEKGVIFVGYKEVAKKRGFFKKIFMLGRRNALPEKAKYPLADVLAHMSGNIETRDVFSGIEGVAFGQALNKLNEGYLIVVKHEGAGARVVIRDNRGRKPPATEVKKLMRLLRKNLI